ncbi:MAG: hypothetical protein IJS54_05885 [Desulfovibrio sp.]|nr:hypothetical protein [Desulfovibrio sp.]
MPAFDVNGYNAQFRNFVDFAQSQVEANPTKGQKSVAKMGEETSLGNHTITANNDDKVGKWKRAEDVKDMNNETRAIFKKAIANMFGGENKIPASVRAVMKEEDYGQGKPLTARRILAVKTAVDQEIAQINRATEKELMAVKKAMEEKVMDASLDEGAVKAQALKIGWKETELPNLIHVAKLLCTATGMDGAEAIKRLSTPGSNESRLMSYGGRFTESPDNFANGLRLMNSFKTWYNDLVTTTKHCTSNKIGNYDFATADTFTKLNADTYNVDQGNALGFEKFIFEELSVNPNANLDETSAENIFGAKNNQATYFFATGFGKSCYSTMASIPKEKRAVIYTAINAFTVPANNVQESNTQHNGKYTKINISDAPTVIARLLKNFDKAEAMYAQGTLTPRNILNEFFPDIRDKGDYNYKTINTFTNTIAEELAPQYDEYANELPKKYGDNINANNVFLTMENTGLTFPETIKALQKGEIPPMAPYVSAGTVNLAGFDGTTKAGRNLLEADLDRPDFNNFFDKTTGALYMKPDFSTGNYGFGFNFPGEDKFYTNGKPKGVANIQRVGDKVEEMCGAVHINQANSVMMMLAQAGVGATLLGGIPQVNAHTNEHSPVDFTFTKNDQTGAITIKYTSQESPTMPFTFEWTATVDVEGNVTTTPLNVTMKQQEPVA